MNRFVFTPPFGVETIMKILPHRPPFLLCDGITHFGETAVEGFKNLSVSEPVFAGHFPGHPVYPGVLQIETAAQVGACWILSLEQNVGKIAYLLSVREAKFRRPVVPGDRLHVKGEISHLKSRSGLLTTEMFVGDTAVSSLVLAFAFSKEDDGSAG